MSLFWLLPQLLPESACLDDVSIDVEGDVSDFISVQQRDGAASSERRLGSTSGRGGVFFELVARWAVLFGRSGGGRGFKGLNEAVGGGALVPRDGYYVAYKPITLPCILFVFIEMKFIHCHSYVMFTMKSMSMWKD